MNKIELTIDTTYKCPFRCPFCSTGNLVDLPDMDYETSVKCSEFLLNLILQYNLPSEVVIAGGEPTADSNLKNIIDVFSQIEGCDVTLCTTGALLKDKTYWSELATSGLKRVRLSLHSVNEQINKSIFGDIYNIDVVIQSIENILSANILLEVNFLFTALNRSCFYDVCKLISNYEIDCIRVLGLSKQGNAIKNWSIVGVNFDSEIITEVINICNDFNLCSVFSGFGDKSNCTHSDDDGHCMGGKTFFHINSNGDVFGCPASKSILANRLGNIWDSSSIHSDVVNSCYVHQLI